MYKFLYIMYLESRAHFQQKLTVDFIKTEEMFKKILSQAPEDSRYGFLNAIDLDFVKAMTYSNTKDIVHTLEASENKDYESINPFKLIDCPFGTILMKSKDSKESLTQSLCEDTKYHEASLVH